MGARGTSTGWEEGPAASLGAACIHAAVLVTATSHARGRQSPVPKALAVMAVVVRLPRGGGSGDSGTPHSSPETGTPLRRGPAGSSLLWARKTLITRSPRPR